MAHLEVVSLVIEVRFLQVDIHPAQPGYLPLGSWAHQAHLADLFPAWVPGLAIPAVHRETFDVL